MITRYLTGVSTTFSPFARSGKTARTFLALLPPTAHKTMAIDIKMLPREQAATTPGTLALKFRDGKEMKLDLEKVKIREIQTEVDRHSRTLKRIEELEG